MDPYYNKNPMGLMTNLVTEWGKKYSKRDNQEFLVVPIPTLTMSIHYDECIKIIFSWRFNIGFLQVNKSIPWQVSKDEERERKIFFLFLSNCWSLVNRHGNEKPEPTSKEILPEKQMIYRIEKKL